MLVQLLCDNPGSWIVPYAAELKEELNALGYPTLLLHEPAQVKEGDILILLSCQKIFRRLDLNKYNLVVHESALPQGKGWSPLTWQVLEGKSEIPVTLFEAAVKVDSGKIYGQVIISLDGNELVDELRFKQFQATKSLILDFINKYPDVKGMEQDGEESFYPRRLPLHSKLDPEKNIKEQFNLLRVCDNERYPAYFEQNGIKFIIKIYKALTD